jgi:hypothetical protein
MVNWMHRAAASAAELRVSRLTESLLVLNSL